jgi:hypothetical protein
LDDSKFVRCEGETEVCGMTPQSDFTVVATLLPGHEEAMRQLLASMNLRPGVVNPENDVIPFGSLDRLHFSRIVVLSDPTVGDITAYGLPAGVFPLQVAFLADFDGPADTFIPELVNRAGPGLRKLFAHCEGFREKTDLAGWMRAHEHTPSTRYVNFVGRTVAQTREEAALQAAIASYVQANRATFASQPPEAIRSQVKQFIASEVSFGRVKLTPIPPTPLGWSIRKILDLLTVPLVLLLALPFLLLYAPIFIYQLRTRERRDPVIAPRPDTAHATTLADIEEHEASNQFTAMGTVKPGLFRKWTLTFILWLIQYTARHIFNHGRLARVSTIHFARWVFIEGKRRLIFASNYDGSLEAYMDDFINKVGFGLNLVFGNGIGYPHTDWLIKGGAKDEQKFKHVLRRHQLPTEVWYNAHRGRTAVELARNSLLRQGLEKSIMNTDEARAWLATI